MLDIAKRALDLVSAMDIDQAEAFVTRAGSTSIKIYGGQIDELASSAASGVGIRVFKSGSEGFAYSSELTPEGLETAAQAAVKNSRVTAPDEYSGLPEPARQYPDLEIYSEKLRQVPLDAKIELAMQVEAAALGHDPRVVQVEHAAYNEAEGTVAIANSLGLAREYRETTCFAYTMAIAEEDGLMQTGMSFTTGREPEQLDADECGHEAAARAVSLLGASQAESMVCPVVTDPFVTSSLIGVIGSVLTAEAVQKKRSLFAGLEGELVAADVFTLLDDGTHPDGIASAPFDGEGVPSGETMIIQEGKLQGFLYDAYTGRKGNHPSTGNGIRTSYRSGPHVGPTNLRVVGGNASQGEIIASLDKGFFVTQVSGIHSGANAVSGDFSVGAAGQMIENGKLSKPVREVTIAGDMLTMLKSIVTVGNDNRWIPFGGSIHAPTLLIEKMTVSGK